MPASNKFYDLVRPSWAKPGGIETSIVVSHHVKVTEAGALVFSVFKEESTDTDAVVIFAPGQWFTVHRQKENNR